jgi:hypothetical protein
MTRLRQILNSYKSKTVKIGKKETLAEEYERSKKEDNVNHPAHYTQGNIECIDAIKIIIQNLKGIEAFALGNHVKYIWREGLKNGDEDIAKADWYWQKYLKERRERNQS